RLRGVHQATRPAGRDRCSARRDDAQEPLRAPRYIRMRLRRGMRLRRALIALVATSGVLVNVGGDVGHAQSFYDGKTVRINVGFAAGGGYDTYARLISRHLGQHIPGNPTLIVDNMPGAGS